MKIALYKNTEYDYDAVQVINGDHDIKYYDDHPEYVRISDFIEVDFPMIKVDMNSKKVKAIDKKIEKAKAGIELLEQTKAELLSIPDLRG